MPELTAGDAERLRAELFDGELTADDAEALVAALIARQERIEAACRRGEAAPEHREELSAIDAYLEVLREEAHIARFVEDALSATLRRRSVLAQAGEELPGG